MDSKYRSVNLKFNMLATCLLAVIMLHVGELAFRFPCNHADAPVFPYSYFAYALALVELIYSIIKRKVSVTFWIVFALSLACPIIEDRCNIFVSYDTWIERGMPEWGSWK